MKKALERNILVRGNQLSSAWFPGGVPGSCMVFIMLIMGGTIVAVALPSSGSGHRNSRSSYLSMLGWDAISWSMRYGIWSSFLEGPSDEMQKRQWSHCFIQQNLTTWREKMGDSQHVNSSLPPTDSLTKYSVYNTAAGYVFFWTYSWLCNSPIWISSLLYSLSPTLVIWNDIS